jgi:4-hydroxyphenylacetate 3-monooxygenase
MPTDTGNGGYTHPFFKAPMSAEDLVVGRATRSPPGSA